MYSSSLAASGLTYQTFHRHKRKSNSMTQGLKPTMVSSLSPAQSITQSPVLSPQASSYKPLGVKFHLNKSRVSQKSYNRIKAYAANTNVGIVKKKNEDRITIMINIKRPKSFPAE